MHNTQMKIPVKKADGTVVYMSMPEFQEYRSKSGAAGRVENAKPKENTSVIRREEVKKENKDKQVQKPIQKVSQKLVNDEKLNIVRERKIPIKRSSKPYKIKPQDVERVMKMKKFSSPLRPIRQVSRSDAYDIMLQTEKHLSTTTPVTNIFIDEAKARVKEDEWKKEDHESLLHTKLTKEDTMDITHEKVDHSDCQAILSKLSFTIKKDLQKRFCLLANSYIKGVRDAEQIKEYLMKSEVEGGLLFTPVQVDEVRKLLQGYVKKVEEKIGEQLRINKQSIKKPERGGRVNIEKDAGEGIDVIDSLLQKNTKAEMNIDDILLNQKQKKKTIIQDVKAVHKSNRMSIGPVDEIATFELINFRRLHNDTKESMNLLKQKFVMLKNESYLLYIEALDVWHESPLFKEYQHIAYTVLQKGITLEQYFSEIQKDDMMKKEEFFAIVELNKHLSY
jgi:hypothetical protein